MGDNKRIQVGAYAILPGMTPGELIHNMATGKVIVYRITFLEGWTFRRMRRELERNPNLKHTISGMTDLALRRQLHLQHKLEGMFFPDTYLFKWGMSDFDILKEAHQHLEKILTQAWQQRARGLPYKSPYQALILASMIEQEARLNSERSQIAGVLLRRLKIRMRLQSDPTVIYGLGRPYGTTLTRQDLRFVTPYNTYRHYGLPPTPICLPSRASIIAAMHPDLSDNLYFVARGDGSHQFSATYAEHQRAVLKYQRSKKTEPHSWRRGNRGLLTGARPALRRSDQSCWASQKDKSNVTSIACNSSGKHDPVRKHTLVNYTIKDYWQVFAWLLKWGLLAVEQVY